MKLYIDDIRPAPEGWHQAKTVSAAIRFIAQFGEKITEISIDHDISYAVEVAGIQRPFPSPETFQPVAYFISIFYSARSVDSPKITIHSANPVGAKQIEMIFKDYSDILHKEIIIDPASRVNRLESEV